MKILLLGKSGQLGSALYPLLSSIGTVIAPKRNSKDLCGDFLQPAKLAKTVQQVRPDIIVNAAAYTAVDQAENEPEIAFRINALAPRILAQEALALDSLLVQYSSDYVFSGQGSRPWQETDRAEPLSVYGQTKLAGDLAIQEEDCKHLILRTSWIYGPHGKNFATKILRQALLKEQLTIVNDQFGTPTETGWLAQLTVNAINQILRDYTLSGLYHVAPEGETTWFSYAKYLLEQTRKQGLQLRSGPETLLPIPSEKWPSQVPRPANSRLSTDRFRSAFELHMEPWQDGVARFAMQYTQTHEH